MANPLPDDALLQIQTALASGNKILAIRLYRSATGAGLADAKNAVEALEIGGTFEGLAIGSATNEDIDQIQAAVFAGRKIQAIKFHRQSTGMGLKESKEFIEALEAELRRIEPGKFTVPPAKGCGMTILLFFATTVAIGLAIRSFLKA